MIQASFELTEGQSRLGVILSSFPSDSQHWNEAQNRFQFIDRLLTECLGWERPNIDVENTDEKSIRKCGVFASERAEEHWERRATGSLSFEPPHTS